MLDVRDIDDNTEQLIDLMREIQKLPSDKQTEVLESLDDDVIDEVKHLWRFWARPKQIAPPSVIRGHDGVDRQWSTWLILAGRGFGKTRAGAEFVIEEARRWGGMRIALVGITPHDVRKTMIEGVSGILACSPSSFMPKYNQSTGEITWPNGAIGQIFSSERPHKLRGPQFSSAWYDEIAACRLAKETWDMLQFGMRTPRPDGRPPRTVVTTTPKAIHLPGGKILQEIMAEPTTVVTRGSTFENAANLSSSTLERWKRVYGGSRLGRQELEAELLKDTQGALWSSMWIDDRRVIDDSQLPRMKRIVIAVDPAVTSKRASDETGIIVAGHGDDGLFYVLDDQSGVLTPNEWGRRVAHLYDVWKADRVIAEVNNGGDLVEENLRACNVNLPISKVHASRGKVARGEPIGALYEQGRVCHVGIFRKLEEQMLRFTGDAKDKDDRVDALVWAIAELSSYTELVWSISEQNSDDGSGRASMLANTLRDGGSYDDPYGDPYY